METLSFVDKSEWSRGPWDQEPDRVYWRDQETGLPCLVLRGPMGAWCGYVAVPPTHPYHGKRYSDCILSPDCGESYCDHGVDFNVHGGITYAAGCQEDDKEQGVCHVPEPGQPDDVWWFGFDCAHHWDLMPMLDFTFSNVYRDLAFVQTEVGKLAQQMGDV